MEQYNDAVEKLKDPELLKLFEQEALEQKIEMLASKYDDEPQQDDGFEDHKAMQRELQKHYREIQKSHQR